MGTTRAVGGRAQFMRSDHFASAPNPQSHLALHRVAQALASLQIRGQVRMLQVVKEKAFEGGKMGGSRTWVPSHAVWSKM